MQRLPRQRSQLTVDEVARLIEHEIHAGSLAPGSRLGTEAEIAARHGSSRPAVREAVRLLAAANLVLASRGPGGGVFVAHAPAGGLARTVGSAIETMLRAGITSLGELLEARMLIEVPLAGLAAARAEPEAVERLRQCIAAGARQLGDASVQSTADTCFHETLAEAAGNQVAGALVAWSYLVLEPELDAVVAPAVVGAVLLEQHQHIFDAVQAHSPRLAEDAMLGHLRYIGDVLETVAPVRSALCR